MPIPAGTKLGSYEIINAIAAGAMGEVYRARDNRLDRFVAIKILPTEFSSDKGRISRFEQFNLSTGACELMLRLMPTDPAGVVRIHPIRITRDSKYYVYSFERVLSTLYMQSQPG